MINPNSEYDVIKFSPHSTGNFVNAYKIQFRPSSVGGDKVVAFRSYTKKQAFGGANKFAEAAQQVFNTGEAAYIDLI